MNYNILKTQLFIKALKTAVKIDESMQFYMSSNGILLLTNYLEFDEIETKKPSYFCLLKRDFFSSVETQNIGYKVTTDASHESRIRVQELNGHLDHCTFVLNIKEIYQSLKAFGGRLNNIQITIGYTIRDNRVLRLFQIICHFDDAKFVVDAPIMFLDDIEQMEKIRLYIDNHQNLDIITLNQDIRDYIKVYSNDYIDVIFQKNSLQISPVSQQNESLDLTQHLLQDYNYDSFKSMYKEYNCLVLETNLINQIEGSLIKLSIGLNQQNQKVRLFLQYELEEQISIILKSNCIIKAKPIQIHIQQDKDVDMNELLEEINRSVQTNNTTRAIVQEQEPQVVKKQRN